MKKVNNLTTRELRRLAHETMGELPTFFTAQKLGKGGAKLVTPMAGPLVGLFVLDANTCLVFGPSQMKWVSGTSETIFGYTDNCSIEKSDRGAFKLRINSNLCLPVSREICESRAIDRIVEFIHGAAHVLKL